MIIDLLFFMLLVLVIAIPFAMVIISVCYLIDKAIYNATKPYNDTKVEAVEARQTKEHASTGPA